MVSPPRSAIPRESGTSDAVNSLSAAYCDQPMAAAALLEEQLAEFVAGFQPSAQIRDEILARLADGDQDGSAETSRRCKQRNDRRRRGLYELGDVERDEYISKRDAIDAELDGLAPGPTPDLDGARAVLENFALSWEQEKDPEPRRELLRQLFERVWLDGQRIVAVRPTPAFVDLFTTSERPTPPRKGRRGVKGGSDGGQTRVLHPGRIEIRA